MPDLDTFPLSRDLPPDIYECEIVGHEKTRDILGPPETVVEFRVLDPEPNVRPKDAKHPHKGFAGRTCRAWFKVEDENEETRYQAERQIGYLTEAATDDPNANLDDLVRCLVRVRVARVNMRSDPSAFKAAAVEFLPYEHVFDLDE